MHIESLYLQKLRNIASHTFSLGPKLNYIIGPNGAGKTTLLEAVHLLTFGTSFRTHQMKELVAVGSPNFFIEGVVASQREKKTIRLIYDGARRNIFLNGEQLPSSSLLLGSLLSVASTPQDSELIFGSPSTRRLFIDEQVAQLDPEYVIAMKRLQRALLQRNALLRKKNLDGIEAWEHQIATATGYICRERYHTLLNIKPYFDDYITTLSQRALHHKKLVSIQLKYLSSLPNIADILGQPLPSDTQRTEIAKLCLTTFKEKREGEMKAGMTLYGPQRDDLLMTWSGNSLLKTQASFGQAKLVALALRLAEWRLINERSFKELPLFLIDDVHSFLDDSLVVPFFDLVRDELGQVLVTSPKAQANIDATMVSVVTPDER